MSALDRRSFLKVAAGAALATQVRPLPALSGNPGKVRGVIWLWMDGGMCQGHTWDPKPDSGCNVKSIPTAVPGVRLSELLPVCTLQMERLSIIRSLSHDLGHPELATELMHVGILKAMTPDLAPIGTILAHELGPKEFPLPKYVSIGGPPVPEWTGFGEDCLPFQVNEQNLSYPISNLSRSVDAVRDQERAGLLLDQNRDWDALRQQPTILRLESAIVRSDALMNTPLLKAFDISEETAELRAEYGEGFGQHCLMARRLVQAGCPFIEIGLGGWGRVEGYPPLTRSLDHGLGALVKDLAQKEMLADTVVVCATAFGKPAGTLGHPHPNDLWQRGFSVVLAGGCLKGGIVHGDTGPRGRDCRPPVSVKDLLATIYRACGVDWNTEYRTEALKKRTYASGGKPVEQLF